MTKFCRECGKRMMIDEDGTAYHLHDLAEVDECVDFDADADHVAIDDTVGDLTCEISFTERECTLLAAMVWFSTTDDFPDLTRDVAIKLLEKFRGNYFS